MIFLHQIFPGIWSQGKKIFTKNLVPSARVYSEKLVEFEGTEYREWVPFRSKLAAAIANGLKQVPIKERSCVLYLGSSEGTTVSHVSDIVGERGIVFGVDVSERVMRKFIGLCEQRGNIVPIVGDANNPAEYREYLGGHEIDLLFQDVSQKNQAEIFNKNAKLFLEKGKFGLIAIKARSISQSKNPKEIFREQTRELEKEFEVVQTVLLKPFEKHHAVVLCKKN